MEQGLLFQMHRSLMPSSPPPSPPSKSSVQQYCMCSRRGIEAVALVNQVGSSRALSMSAHGTLTDVL